MVSHLLGVQCPIARTTYAISFKSFTNLLVEFVMAKLHYNVISDVKNFQVHNIWKNVIRSIIKLLDWACTIFEGTEEKGCWDAKMQPAGPNRNLVSPSGSCQFSPLGLFFGFNIMILVFILHYIKINVHISLYKYTSLFQKIQTSRKMIKSHS